jgi:5-methylcytosine-specific restriction protein A
LIVFGHGKAVAARSGTARYGAVRCGEAVMSKIETQGRSVDEWIGTTPNSAVPPHVRLRIFDRCKGVCHISRRKIMAGERWDLDHVIPLADGGEHRESNLAPAIADKHREKTAEENRDRAKVRGKRSKHLGINRSRTPIPGSRGTKWKRTIDGRTVER